MPFQVGNRNGGKRAGAGRKPSEFTKLKRRINAEKVDDAEFAFSLYATVMHDGTKPIALRLDCANWIAERVLGKPAQMSPGEGEELYKLHMERLRAVIFSDELPEAGSTQVNQSRSGRLSAAGKSKAASQRA